MALEGRNPIRPKIVLHDQILEQVSNFNYMGRDILYDYNKDRDKKHIKGLSSTDVTVWLKNMDHEEEG